MVVLCVRTVHDHRWLNKHGKDFKKISNSDWYCDGDGWVWVVAGIPNKMVLELCSCFNMGITCDNMGKGLVFTVFSWNVNSVNTKP